MAEQKRFQHIAVTSADDDVVIRAGAPVRDQPRAAADEPKAATTAQPAESAPEAYRETTLEDIQGSKMPMAQRVVIVVAVLAIAAFAAWYALAGMTA